MLLLSAAPAKNAVIVTISYDTTTSPATAENDIAIRIAKEPDMIYQTLNEATSCVWKDY